MLVPRYYATALSRWAEMDPADEFHSPYTYVGNDPVNLVDPNGAQSLSPADKAMSQAKAMWDSIINTLTWSSQPAQRQKSSEPAKQFTVSVGSPEPQPVLPIPLEAPGARITSDYGPRILDGSPDNHRGIDIAAVEGTPVLSPAAGRVGVHQDVTGGGGMVVLPQEDWELQMIHFGSISVEDGTTVSPGDTLGRIGQQQHLHMEAQRDPGVFNDPEQIMPMPYLNAYPDSTD